MKLFEEVNFGLGRGVGSPEGETGAHLVHQSGGIRKEAAQSDFGARDIRCPFVGIIECSGYRSRSHK